MSTDISVLRVIVLFIWILLAVPLNLVVNCVTVYHLVMSMLRILL